MVTVTKTTGFRAALHTSDTGVPDIQTLLASNPNVDSFDITFGGTEDYPAGGVTVDLKSTRGQNPIVLSIMCSKGYGGWYDGTKLHLYSGGTELSGNASRSLVIRVLTLQSR